MQGTIIYYDERRGTGFLNGEDGNRYHFASADLAAGTHPAKGMTVRFDATGNHALRVTDPSAKVGSSPPSHPQRSAAPSRRTDEAAGTPPRLQTTPSPRGVAGHFLNAVTTRYADFSGRGSRREFWSFLCGAILLLAVVAIGGTLLDIAAGRVEIDDGELEGEGMLLGVIGAALCALALIPPLLAATIRRIHDVGLPGAVILVGFIPTIGNLAMIAVALVPSQSGPNKWGPPPEG